jgi:hypothetical protein
VPLKILPAPQGVWQATPSQSVIPENDENTARAKALPVNGLREAIVDTVGASSCQASRTEKMRG